MRKGQARAPCMWVPNRRYFSSPWAGRRPMTSPVEKHSQERSADTADLSTTLRSGRDDKGDGGASIECGCRTEAIFHHLGRPAGPCLLRSKNIPRKGPLTPQISPLRCAPVEM